MANDDEHTHSAYVQYLAFQAFIQLYLNSHSRITKQSQENSGLAIMHIQF